MTKVTQTKNAGNIVKHLEQSSRFLFGEQLGKVAKNLKESDQLNPLAASARFNSNPRGGGSGSSRSWYSAGSRSRGRGGQFSGSSNYRLARFGGPRKFGNGKI